MRATDIVEIGGSDRSGALVGIGRSPGTAGQLVHGALGGRTAFHLSAPTAEGSRISLECTPSRRWSVTGADGRHRLRRAIIAAGTRVGAGPFEVQVRRRSDVPDGCELGASSADVVAAIRAMSALSRRPLGDDTVGRLACAVLRSADAVWFDQPVLADHRTGQLLLRPDWWPELWLLTAYAPGPERLRAGPSTHPAYGRSSTDPAYQELLDRTVSALRSRDPAALCAAASMSARLRHSAQPVDGWGWLLATSGRSLPDGVAVAPAGTLVSCLFLDGDHARVAFERAKRRTPTGSVLRLLHLAGPAQASEL
jgi:uncharacterized protein involved in propanediol utilization